MKSGLILIKFKFCFFGGTFYQLTIRLAVKMSTCYKTLIGYVLIYNIVSSTTNGVCLWLLSQAL